MRALSRPPSSASPRVGAVSGIPRAQQQRRVFLSGATVVVAASSAKKGAVAVRSMVFSTSPLRRRCLSPSSPSSPLSRRRHLSLVARAFSDDDDEDYDDVELDGEGFFGVSF